VLRVWLVVVVYIGVVLERHPKLHYLKLLSDVL